MSSEKQLQIKSELIPQHRFLQSMNNRNSALNLDVNKTELGRLPGTGQVPQAFKRSYIDCFVQQHRARTQGMLFSNHCRLKEQQEETAQSILFM